MDAPTDRSTPDASLVTDALAGDRDAVAAVYERYADRVHTMCAHMLRDPHEAADACAEVFLVAFARLGQLRDPQRLRPWLFAIARHEVYRRTRRRSRVELVEEVEEMERVAAARTSVEEVDPLDADEMIGVVHAAADGLEARDRMVMELQLQGLQGDDLAAALGTSPSTAYQRVHRMKERLGRSVGAMLVARQGREDCAQLDDLLRDWDGTFSVIWRKRVARHIDRCAVCDRRRAAVPAALLGTGVATLVTVGAGSASAAPASVRDRVLSEAAVGVGGRGWRSDGFPPRNGRSARVVAAGAVALAVLVLVGLLVTTVLGDEGDRRVVRGDSAAPATAVSDAATTSTAQPPPDTSTPSTVAPSTPAPPPVPPVVADPSPQPDVSPTPPVETPAPPAPPAAPEPAELSVTWGSPPPTTVFNPAPGSTSCGASELLVVVAPTSDAVVLEWSGPDAEGVVDMVPAAGRWEAVLEVPPGVTGPLTVVAVATAPGATASSESVTAAVARCIPPD